MENQGKSENVMLDKTRLLRDSKFLDAGIANVLLEDSEEILRILTTILKSSKNKN